jgi:hypothetical protein
LQAGKAREGEGEHLVQSIEVVESKVARESHGVGTGGSKGDDRSHTCDGDS